MACKNYHRCNSVKTELWQLPSVTMYLPRACGSINQQHTGLSILHNHKIPSHKIPCSVQYIKLAIASQNRVPVAIRNDNSMNYLDNSCEDTVIITNCWCIWQLECNKHLHYIGSHGHSLLIHFHCANKLNCSVRKTLALVEWHRYKRCTKLLWQT